MSLMRALTNRRNRPEMELMISPNQLGRAASQRGGKPVFRSQISGPVALVSTTNMLSYEAPDIHHSASASSSSDEDSDASTLSINTSVTTVTDASSIENSPTSPNMEPNHLSCYFNPAVNTTSTIPSRSPSNASRATFDAPPAIPKRVPSHSKRAHEHIHRKRSVQRIMSPPSSVRSSTDMFSPFSPARSAFVETPKESPFGNELAQLDEVAEEMGTVVRDAETQSDVDAMKVHDLAHFGASEYLSEIAELVATTFPVESPTWI